MLSGVDFEVASGGNLDSEYGSDSYLIEML